MHRDCGVGAALGLPPLPSPHGPQAGKVTPAAASREGVVLRDTPEKTLATEAQGVNPSDPREELKVVGELRSP